MSTEERNQSSRSGSSALGIVFIVLGAFFLLAQFLDIDLGRFTWPFFIIIPGILVFVFALATGGATGEGIAIFGSVVTVTGLLLLYQNTFNHFESWAYAWALVAPTSVGLGRMIYGSLKGNQNSVQAGLKLASIGGVIFLVGFVFFELVIGISGFGLGGIGMPILLVGLGALLLLRNFLPGVSAKPRQEPEVTIDSTPEPVEIDQSAEENN